MTDDLRSWVVESRRAGGLPDQIEDPATLARLARLVVHQRPVAAAGRPIPMPTSSALVVGREHPRLEKDDALRGGASDPEGNDRGADPRVQEYAATRQ